MNSIEAVRAFASSPMFRRRIEKASAGNLDHRQGVLQSQGSMIGTSDLKCSKP